MWSWMLGNAVSTMQSYAGEQLRLIPARRQVFVYLRRVTAVTGSTRSPAFIVVRGYLQNLSSLFRKEYFVSSDGVGFPLLSQSWHNPSPKSPGPSPKLSPRETLRSATMSHQHQQKTPKMLHLTNRSPRVLNKWRQSPSYGQKSGSGSHLFCKLSQPTAPST